MESKQHPFEAAHMGKAPFILTGVRENVYRAASGHAVAGGTCDYCSTGIRWEYHIRSADGIASKVGCDCIMKLDRADNRELHREAQAWKAKVDTETRRRRATAKRLSLKAQLAEALEALSYQIVRDQLTQQPHPKLAGKTMLDYVEFLLTNNLVGDTGRQRGIKIIDSLGVLTESL